MKNILIITIILFTISCGSKNINILENKSFLFTENKNITISFDKEKVFGFSGVNYFMGFYKISKNNITFKDIVTTMMAGKIKDMSNEDTFLKNLNNSNKFYLENDTLFLGDKLIFKEDK